MDIAATMTSKGQITVPKDIRNALGIQPGDKVLFRVYKDQAVLAKIPSFLDLAGSVPVPPNKRGKRWSEVRAETRRERSTRSR